MTKATPQRESSGLIEPRPNQPFSIHVPEAIWVVHSGSMDLFLVDMLNGEPVSARYPLLRVQQHRAVFGMRPNDRVSVIAVATPGTQLRYMSQDDLRGKTPEPAGVFDPLALLENWILALAASSSLVPLPNIFLTLDPGNILEVGEDTKPIVPTEELLWVEHLEGLSRFMNASEITPITRGVYFPISKNGWLQPCPQSRIRPLTSADWQKLDPQWRGLQAFHDVMLERFILDRATLEDSDRVRRVIQAESDANIIRHALQSLATPLSGEQTPLPSTHLGSSNPTILACEAIGHCLGVNIVVPVELRTHGAVKDPVSRIANASGLRLRRVALKSKWWTNLQGPLLAFREPDNYPLAVLPSSNSAASGHLYDPLEQRSVPITADIAMTLSGFGYAFYRPFPNRQLSLWDLIRFGLHDTRRELVSVLTLGIFGGLLAMILPVATGIIFSSAIPNAQRGQLLEISTILAVLACAGAMFTLTRNFAMLRLEGKMGASLQAAIWDRLLRLPVPFYRRFTAGDLADRSLGIDLILRTLTGSVIFTVLSRIFSIFSFLLLFYYSWQLAIVATVIVFVGFAASAASIYGQLRYQRQLFHARGRISGMVLGFIDNIARLRVSGAEPRAFAVWAREFSHQKQLSMRARVISRGLAVFNSAFPVISLAAIFACSTKLIGQPLLQTLTTGTFLAFLAAFIQFQTAALQLSSAVESALSIVPIHERATPILDTIPEVTEANRHPGELRGSIEVSHLNFRYSADLPLVLRNVSLSIRPGEFVAIVGPSGSGKSSLFRLLLGFEKPESGAIYFDGQDLAALDIQVVRQQMGTVIQNARLASGSIFMNIVGSSPLTIEDAWEAAVSAGLSEDIRAMPMGMHTIVSEGGGNLSGGQRQRLLIARAIARKPRIFLLDEATSALDNRTQAIVSRSLEALQSTRIVIAHRLSTIVNASRIFVMDKGVLVQTGCYAELANQPGLLRELATRQLL